MNIFPRIILVITAVIVLSLLFISLAQSTSDILTSPPEQFSPSDWIQEEQIKVYNDKVILNILNPTWAKFTNTNSMDPFIDEHANAIEIIPDDPDHIEIGDVIAYETASGVIIHRVIQKGTDKEGLFYTVKGDNTTIADPVKVRFDDIRGVVVAVIY